MQTAWVILVIIAGVVNALNLGYREGIGTWIIRQAFSMLWITVLVAIVGWAIRQVFGG